MTLEPLWAQLQAQGYASVRDIVVETALEHFYKALLAFAEDDFIHAAQFARAAAEIEPESRVYTQAVHYLDRLIEHGKGGVYVDGEAFAAFIRGGGNVYLYAAVSDALRAQYEQHESLSLLDIGVGDGLALLPALTGNIRQLDLLEPSDAMLGRTSATLDARGVAHSTTNATLQTFMAQNAGKSVHWDVIQATWSLQSIQPEERPAIFAWLREHGDRVLIAEFDVPEFSAMFGPDRVRYVLSHYENGLAEYDGDGGLVAQGFLMPVMFGYFDRSAARTNWEGPIQHWIAGLHAAGFAQVTLEKLYSYFWADSYLIMAQ